MLDEYGCLVESRHNKAIASPLAADDDRDDESRPTPQMKFFLDRPDCDHYWLIAYDVRFSGTWSGLFADLSSSKADLLCTTIQMWAENANWAHWGTLIAQKGEGIHAVLPRLPRTDESL